MAQDRPDRVIHASTVAIDGQGVLILGASGRGKSALALELMALGAGLVADDRTVLAPRHGHLWASCPDAIRGRIEARYVGILCVRPHPPVPLALVVDLDREEDQRLPPQRTCDIDGVTLPVLHNCAQRHFPAAIRQYLLSSRHNPEE